MEDDQQFCLRWNNHQSTLIQNFDTLLESGTLVDCTLAAEGKYLKAHKVVLSACSPYFEGLLSEHYDKHPVFILKDVKFKELKAMMDYMYRGEVNISQDQLAALLKAAESLQIKGLSESKTGGSSKTMDSRQQKVVSQTTTTAADIPHGASGLTIEKNKVPRQVMTHGPVGDLPEDSASPQLPKGLSSREGSQSPTSRKRKKFRRRSVGEETSVENHDASNSSDMPQQMSVPALGIAPVADEKSHADPTDSIGRSALMTQLTKPADEMIQIPLEKPEPNDNLIEPKSEYLEDPEESVEDLTLDDDMNDLNEMEQDTNRAGPSHDPSQHPAGMGAWHVAGDRTNAGVVGSVAGAPGTTDEVFLAAQEAAQAHRDSQDVLFHHSGYQSVGRAIMLPKRGRCNKAPLTNRTTARARTGASLSVQCSPPLLMTAFLSSSRRTPLNNPAPRSASSSGMVLAPVSRPVSVPKLSPMPAPVASPGLEPVASMDLAPASSLDSWIDTTQANAVPRPSQPTLQMRPLPPSTQALPSSSRALPSSSQALPSSSQAMPSSSRRLNQPRAGPSRQTAEDWTDVQNLEDMKYSEKCPHCGKAFANKHHLGRHILNNCLSNPDSKCNSDHSKFVCKKCGCRFTLAKALSFHKRHDCGQYRVCPHCGRTFAGGTISTKHLTRCREKHTQENAEQRRRENDDTDDEEGSTLPKTPRRL